MPKTYVFPKEFEANNLDNSTLNPNSKAYFALCDKLAQDLTTLAEQQPEIDFETYDPRDVKTPEEYSTLDKFWVALLALQKKDEPTYNNITYGDDLKLKGARKFSSIMKAGRGQSFHIFMGDELKKLIGAYYQRGADGFSGLTPEENRMFHELVGPVVGVKEIELAENTAEANSIETNEVAPEASTVEVKLPASTLAFFNGAAHQSGTTLFETMRNRAVELANQQSAEPGELDALKTACFNYIKGKEAERATQKGRERFKMALSMLKTLTTEDEFQQELDRINGIRAAKWFGRGGEALHAYDFDEPVAATAENESEKAPELPANLSENTEQRGFRPELADAANAFFASAAHGKGSMRYNAMRDSVKALLSGNNLENIPEQQRKAAVDACRAYIERKENERVTQSGRERFRMAMTLLHELLPAGEFRQEIERINRVRKGTPLDAAEYGTDRNISKLNLAAGKRDCLAAYEERHDALFAVLNDKNRGDKIVAVTENLSYMLHFQTQMKESGPHTEPNERAAYAYMSSMLSIEGEKAEVDITKIGLTVAVGKLIQDKDYRDKMLTEEQIQKGLPLFKEEVVKEEINASVKNTMEALENGTYFGKNNKIGRDHAGDLEDRLAKCAAAHLLARDAKKNGDGTTLDLHTLEGTRALLAKTSEVREANWFKATMAEIVAPNAEKKALLGDMSLSSVISSLKNGDASSLLAVYDKTQSKELDEGYIKTRADDFDVVVGRKYRIDNGMVVPPDSPAGQMQHFLNEAKKAASLDTRKTAIANVLAARLVCEKHQDKLTQSVDKIEEEQRGFAMVIAGYAEPKKETDRVKLLREVVDKASRGNKPFEELCSIAQSSPLKPTEKESSLDGKLSELVQKVDKKIMEKRQKKQNEALEKAQNKDKKDDAGANGPSVG